MAVDAARAKSLFLTASDLTDPAERAAYLERECGGDAELLARVEALLAADGGGAPVLDEGLTGAHEPTSPATLEATAASRAETRLPSELATAEDRSDGADFTLAGARRPIAPADQAWARSSPAGTRCSKSSARGEWAPFTGPVRLNRSSGRWRSS